MGSSLTKLLPMLAPPGEGVFTVHTARERRESLQNKLFAGEKDIQAAHRKVIEQESVEGQPWILGICSDAGGGILRGANWGPLFLRESLLEESPKISWRDLGDIRVIPHLLHDRYVNQETLSSCREALYQDEKNSLPVSPLSQAEHVAQTFFEESESRGKLLSLGGDHSVSFPLVKHYLRAKKKFGKRAGILHFDAHTDLLDKRLGIDYCFGSWVYHILPEITDPADIVQVGIRSSGQNREYWEKKFGLTQIWTKDVQQKGPEEISEEIIKQYKSQGIEELYCSFDIDALDAKFASATGTPEVDGLQPHEVFYIMEKVFKEFPLTSADLVEVAPLTTPMEEYKNQEPFSTLSVGGNILHKMLEFMNANN